MELTKRMIAIVKRMNVGFTLKGQPVAPQEVFSDTGLLPGIVKRADQLASLCFGYGLGATYEDIEKSLLGVRVKFDEFTPDILRIFCITDTLYELVKSSPSSHEVALDELMYD
ncbi:MAG: type IV secretion protein IcmS [Gammaproteobacteria bacterium]|nr:type IV secretion protein IcmS [Gammaproteobacteria bacterium]